MDKVMVKKIDNTADQKNISDLIDASKQQIQAANDLIDKMKAMYAQIGIKEGSGRRYLKKTSPSMEVLKKAEKQFLGKYKKIDQKSLGKKNTLQALRKFGEA